jgi:hypothetical protein
MDNILRTLYSHFGRENVSSIEKQNGVFLCEKKTSDRKTYQIIFIDTTDNWCRAEYSKYLESVVIDKYYSAEGFLQWNFYYYFITTIELIQTYAARKKEIECDETYTRKSVLTEEEFAEWLISFDSISEISKDAISNDLYTNWVNYLREKKLYFVFNYDKYPNYKQPIDDYINGISSEDIEELRSNDLDTNSEPILQKIDKLELLEFRKYPLTRNFVLGNVNLIHGPNAVGKTSFFDAIELIITGKLFYKAVNGSYNIQFTDDSGNVLKYPARPAPYKKRDIEWYNSGSNRGNELNGNFNKFNYYTSDAAFQLKQDDANAENNLESIIADIALGREVNKLEDRINAFVDRFGVLADSFLSESISLNESLKEKNETVIELNNQQKNPQGYKSALIESLKNNFWKTTIDNNDSFIAKLDNEIQTVVSILSNIQSKGISFDKLSKESVEAELKDLSFKQLSITALRNELLQSQTNRQVYLKEIDSIKNLLPLMSELSLYYKHEQFDFLIGIENSINVKSNELNKAKEIKALADSILSNELFSNDSKGMKSVKQIDNEIKLREEELNKKYLDVEFKITQIEEGIEELSVIISDIKTSGQLYLKLNPDAQDCPLCNTPFLNSELAEAISRTQESFTNSIALISLKEELEFLSKRLNEIEEQLTTTNKLKHLAFLIFVSDAVEKTFFEIQSGCSENIKTLNSLTELLIRLNTIRSQFNKVRIPYRHVVGV